jgi:hypothetical protein
MGKRYSKLPSEVLASANTFDLWVFDVAVTYRNHQQEKDLMRMKNPEAMTLNDALNSSDPDPNKLQEQLEKWRANQRR